MARGFGSTFGSGSSDAVDTQYKSSGSANRSYFLRFLRHDTGGSGFGRVFQKGTGTGQEALWWDTDNMHFVRCQTGSTSKAADHKFLGTDLVDTEYALAFSHSSNSALVDPTAYVNGSAATTGLSSSVTGDVPDEIAPFVIGNRGDNARAHDGWIAEFTVWNDHELTASEMEALTGDHYSPRLIRPDKIACYVPLIRDVVDLKNGAPTVTGGAVQPHPRVFLPKRRMFGFAAAVVSGDATATPSGVSATAAVGSVTALDVQTASPTGVSATASVGTVVTKSDATVAQDGLAAAAAVGSVSLLLDSTIALTGLAATASVGTVTAASSTAQVAAVSGVEATAQVGSVSVLNDMTVQPQGLVATAAVGSVFEDEDVSGISAGAGVGSGKVGTGTVGTENVWRALA